MPSIQPHPSLPDLGRHSHRLSPRGPSVEFRTGSTYQNAEVIRHYDALSRYFSYSVLLPLFRHEPRVSFHHFHLDPARLDSRIGDCRFLGPQV